MKLKRAAETKLAVQVSPLIDVVFLLLIYFMVTAVLIKREGDVAFTLPGGSGNDVPIGVVVEIRADGSIELDGMHFSSDDKSLNALGAHVAGLKQMAVSHVRNSSLTFCRIGMPGTVGSLTLWMPAPRQALKNSCSANPFERRRCCSSRCRVFCTSFRLWHDLRGL